MTLLSRLAAAISPPPSEAKATSGIGAFWMSTEPQLSVLQRSPQKVMAEAQSIAVEDRWIRAAERVISQRFSTVAWHLEDAADEELGTDHPAYQLLEKPYRPLPGDPRSSTPRTRSALWALTSRHMGVCGSSFWYLDQIDAAIGMPLQTLYINPARMTPDVNDNGNLTRWVLDYDGHGRGTPLDIDKVLHFQLEPADRGFLPPGLVESAAASVTLGRMADRHAAGVLASGGRLAGVFSPKGDQSIPPDQFAQLQRDLRSITEAPDAAKRTLVLQGPIDFTRTAATPEELDLVAVAAMARDDKLALWGVPYSQLGGSSPAGLNSGGKGGFEEAALWQNAVGPRLRVFREVLQFELLDRLGGVELEIDEPEFDDDLPQFVVAEKAQNLPLTNMERREMIGQAPFGDARDYEVWLPSSIVKAWTAPLPAGVAPLVEDVPPPAPPPFPMVPFGKASPLRKHADVTFTPKMQRAIQSVLDEQRAEIAGKVQARAAHLEKKPSDTTVWWNGAKWDTRLTDAISPFLDDIATASESDVRKRLHKPAGKAAPSVVARLLKAIGKRITGINETTRDAISALIQGNIGLGGAELGRLVTEATAFGSNRAETIARTETGTYLNQAQVATFGEFGVDRVEVIDGDGDDECASADGQTWTTDEADANPLAHPNCTRDFLPVIDEPKARLDPDALDPERLLKLAAAFKGVQDAMTTYVTVNVPEAKAQPTPEVHVHVPQQAAPIVNVAAAEAPVVNVTTPEVTVTVPEAKALAVQDIRIIEMPHQPVDATIKRDSQGRIVGVKEA